MPKPQASSKQQRDKELQQKSNLDFSPDDTARNVRLLQLLAFLSGFQPHAGLLAVIVASGLASSGINSINDYGGDIGIGFGSDSGSGSGGAAAGGGSDAFGGVGGGGAGAGGAGAFGGGGNLASAAHPNTAGGGDIVPMAASGMATLLAVRSAVQVLAEVPSGVIADRLGYARALSMATLLRLICVLLLAYYTADSSLSWSHIYATAACSAAADALVS
eukprot:UC1_evm1s396